MVLSGIPAVNVIAISIAVLTLPMLGELLISILGNLRQFSTPRKTLVRDVRLAVIVPAHQQEAAIAQTVQSLLHAGCSEVFSRRIDRSNSGTWEIPIVVSAWNCTDSTAAVAAGFGARVVAVEDETPAARDRAIRQGLDAAEVMGANAFLIVDSTSAFTPNLVAATRAAIAAGAAATQSRVELLSASAYSAGPIARIRELVFRGHHAMGARGRAGLGFSAGLLNDGFALTAFALEKVPFNPSDSGSFAGYHRRLLAAGLSVRWIDHAITCWSDDTAVVQELPADLKSAFAVFKGALLSFAQLSLAFICGRWRAFEPLLRCLSLPFFLGGALMLTAARLPVEWCQLIAVIVATLFFVFVLEDLVLGVSIRRSLRALGGVPGHRVHASPQATGDRDLQKKPLLDGVRRQVRLP